MKAVFWLIPLPFPWDEEGKRKQVLNTESIGSV